MPSPFDMITHSPIMQLANLARAGQNPMGLIQQLGGQSAPIMQGLNLIQGKNEAQLRTMAQNLAHDEAEEWCDSMVNADGTKGCHWTLEQTQDVAKQRNINCDPNDFWAVMNMMYSDYCQVAKRQSVDTPGFYADMAKAFLEDADAADGKAYLYWDCIADK